MAAGDVYDRMESIARGERPGPRLLRQRILELVILILTIFLLGYLLYAAQFSGEVRWLLGCALITVLALYAWFTVSRSTAEPAPLTSRPAAARTRFGALASLAGVVHRANQGLPYSQVAVSSRAREAFEERVRLARGLTPEAMRGLERDRDALRGTIHDPYLADFVHLASNEPDERYRWVYASRDGDGFEVSLQRILDRMEEWR